MVMYDMLKNQGYVNDDLVPIKCFHCGSNELETGNEWRDEKGIVEYETICSNCKEVLGGSSYGANYLNYEYGEINYR